MDKRDSLDDKIIQKVETVQILLSEQDRNLKATTEALQAARERINTLEDVLVPGLVSANETFHRSWDAQTAAHARQQALMQHKQSEQ